MHEVTASIITIGDELLIGQTIDTNSAYIAQELNKIGAWVRRRVAIADDKEAILTTLGDEAKQSNILIITGGLGPTADDITKPALCEYFNTELIRDEGATTNVENIFQKLARPITERNLSQGLVPANCEVLPNGRGTAPGMYFNQEDVHYFSLPGVPHEMKGLMQSGVLPKIKSVFRLPAVAHRTLLTAGIGESFLADTILDFETALPAYVKLAYLPAYGMVRLRLTAKGEDEAAIKKEVDEKFAELKSLVKEWMVADEDIPIQEAVVKLLKEKAKAVATAESCTGGTIASLITSVAGSSAVFNGGIVSYANEAKKDMLEVKEETLTSVGAVSEEAVTQMAISACKKLKTDYAVATSGIMGPDGGTPEKPVGTVWIAVANKEGKVKAQKSNFRFDRGRNVELTVHTALNMLRKAVLEDAEND
ncbi:competence/damage-inducible protein A [Flavisolibacter ginsenosidimutans]|uniref:CinA-like protein n=1 Tax=Flavisolibacter ginsenosidimutans TaxID=661481 RepID=A0A5B8UDA4_9BACT|nr:competence/damage-inducible protein A [Flavisolibacter ginsenosidimutans]QEC54657.1 competence/damage-inducible protein A [Flavisolibacter ginsenosidimutans]